MSSNPSTSNSQAGPSRPKPPPKPTAFIDLTLSSDEDDCIVMPSRASKPVNRPANKDPLKPTTKSNYPPVKPSPLASKTTGLPKSSSTSLPKVKSGPGLYKHDAISIASTSSVSSRGTASSSGGMTILGSSNPTPRAGKKSTSGGGFGSHKPKEKSATPALGERGRMGRTVSRDKVEFGSASGSVSGSRRGSSSKRVKVESKSTKTDHPFFASSQSRKVKPEPKSPLKQSHAGPSRHSRKTSSVSSHFAPIDEVDAFFSPAVSKHVKKTVISPGSALLASRSKSSSVISADRTPTKRQPGSGEKRKRSNEAEEDYVPRVRQVSVPAPAPTGRVRVRSERTANNPPVNYIIPTMEAPLTEWTRGKGSPKRATPSSVLSSAPDLSRAPSTSSSAMPTESAPSPKRQKKTPARTPMVRTGSTTSTLTSLSSQPTPSRKARRLSTAQNTPIGRKLSSMGHTPRGLHATPGKTPRAKAPEPVEEPEEEDDLLAQFDDFDFTAPSPEMPSAELPTKAEISPNATPRAAPARLSLSPHKTATSVKAELSPGTIKRILEAEIDAKLAREAEVKEAARRLAEEEKASRIKGWEAKVQEEEEEEEEPQIVMSTAQMLQETRRPRRPSSEKSDSPRRAKPSKADREAEQILRKMNRDHDMDTSFENAVAYSRSESRSPHTSSILPSGAYNYPTPTSREPSLEPPLRERDLERMVPEVVIPLPRTPRKQLDPSKVSLQDLDEGLRGGAADLIQEATEASEEAKEVLWEGVWVRPQSRVDVDAAAIEMTGVWGMAIKSAHGGDFDMLYMLVTSPALAKLDGKAIEGLATFCLQKWLSSGMEGAMTCLFAIAELSNPNPFNTSSNVKDIVCTILAALGMDEAFLPSYTAVTQASPCCARDAAVGSLAMLVKKLIGNWMLSEGDAVDIAVLFCLIFADPSTSSASKDHLGAALAELWPVCLEHISSIQLASKIVDVLLPPSAQRDVLFAIGMASKEAREISQWAATGFLRPENLAKVLDKPVPVPTTASIERGLNVIIDELEMEDTDHLTVDHYLFFLYAMMSDINGLVYSVPLTKKGKRGLLDKLRNRINGADAAIKRSTKATRTEIRNKMKLGQLSAILGVKAETITEKRRAEEERRREKEMRENGKGLIKGEGGQTKLSFGVKKDSDSDSD